MTRSTVAASATGRGIRAALRRDLMTSLPSSADIRVHRYECFIGRRGKNATAVAAKEAFTSSYEPCQDRAYAPAELCSRREDSVAVSTVPDAPLIPAGIGHDHAPTFVEMGSGLALAVGAERTHPDRRVPRRPSLVRGP
jgi:hypothetical protein